MLMPAEQSLPSDQPVCEAYTVEVAGCAGAPAELAKLHRIIQEQMANQAALVSLTGRLDLLCAQIPSASGVQDVVYQPQVGPAG